MKRIAILLMAAVLVAAPQTSFAQNNDKSNKGVLGKALGAAGKGALGNLAGKVTEKVTEKVTDRMSEKVQEKVDEKMPAGLKEVMKNAEAMEEAGTSNVGVSGVAGSKETLQPRRSSSFGWDGTVTLSTAKFPVPLMNEFPALPTAAQLAKPEEEAAAAYFKAIKAVTLRAEELNSDETCKNEETEMWRKRYEKALMDAYGLNEAEIALLNKPDLTAAEQKVLEEKITAAMFGGVNLDNMETPEAMSQDEAVKMLIDATLAVYDRHDAECRKYMGMSAAEVKENAMKCLENESYSKTVEAKVKAHQTAQAAKDPNFMKEAKAFEAQIKKESEAAAKKNTKGMMGDLAQVSANMNNISEKMKVITDMQVKYANYLNAVEKVFPKKSFDTEVDAKFAAAEKKKIEAIKAKIYSTDKYQEYDPLYLEAGRLIATYRERAAAVWLADVQKRYSSVKESMPEFIKIQRQAVADEIIPECALWRVPLNAVIYAGDILAEAYSSFPCDYPPLYSRESVLEIPLADNESAWWPEFAVMTGLNEILAGKFIFKYITEASGAPGIYQFNNGSWTKMPDDYGTKPIKGAVKPASATWTSHDGKRTTSYNAEGGFIQLPEGDIIYPMAWEKQGDILVWAEMSEISNPSGGSVYKIFKCTYKL